MWRPCVGNRAARFTALPRPGTEVPAVNGTPVRAILDRLMAVARADGANDAIGSKGNAPESAEAPLWRLSFLPDGTAYGVEILRAVGPGLGRPQVDTVKGSRCRSGLIDGEWFNQVESAGTS